MTTATPLPQLVALEAERAVLGTLLLEAGPENLLQVREALGGPSAFGHPAHQELCAAIFALAAKGAPVDPVTVREYFSRQDHTQALDALGGEEYFATLVDEGHLSGRVEPYHLELIRDRALRRVVRSHAAKALELAADLREDLTEALRESIEALAASVAPMQRRRAVAVKHDLWPVMEQIEARNRQTEQLDGIPTGLHGLDALLQGLRPGQLVLLAARPSMGKTSLALHVARAAAAAGHGTFVASAEMSRQELVERMLGAEAQVNLRARPLRDGDYTQLAHAAGILSALPIVIDDAAVSTPAEIRLAAQYHAATSGVGAKLLVLDYLQLLRGSGNTRNEEVAGISRALKLELAKGLQLPVLALSQLSREGEKQGRRPRLSDLRDSGALEQDADVVLFLHQTPEQAAIKQVTVEVAKQRNGPTGEAQVYFNRATGAWSDWAKEAA